MAETQSRPRLVRFGAFEADLRTGELRKDGVKLKFSGQPFQVLAILLERPGEVVTREELQKRLWPDTFVDVERNLNTAVNKIREVLGDSAESPCFVETLPRRGYRFIGELERPVEPVVGPAAEPVMASMAEPAHRSDFRKLWWKVTAGIAIIAVVAGVIYLRSKPQRPQEQAVLTAVPFTALPGDAISPAFSPDGSRIAFAWSGGDSKGGAKGFDLYVKVIGSETLLRLTQHPSDWISGAWSPDGTQIVFHRLAGTDTGLYVVPALGGPERKLRSTLMRSPEPMALDYSIVSWSLDGKWIAFADELSEGRDVIRMYLLSTETLETKQAPIGPKCDEQGMPAFSHNGEYLAYWCIQHPNDEARLYSVPLPDGEPKMIATFREIPSGLTWSADGKRLIYSVWNARSYILGEVSVANGSVKRLDFAENASQPTVSSKGDKLAFRTSYLSSKILRRDLLQPASPAVELIPSSRAQFDAQYSPDGKRIALASLRSGLQGVWISNEDGSNLVQISNPAYMSGSPQWSPDGNKIAFDSLSLDRWEIFVADVADRKPRKLVTNVFGLIRPHWSRDGKWIYFRSQEPGKTGVYRCPSSGGDAVAISKDPDGISPQESFDGKTVYFASRQQGLTLKKVALQAQPGTESEVDGLPHVRGSNLWALSPGGIYFVAAEAPRSLRYFDFATGQIHPVFEMDNNFGGTLSISPDGRWILYSQAGEVYSDIMLVDNFH